jgi:hypothetical protein
MENDEQTQNDINFNLCIFFITFTLFFLIALYKWVDFMSVSTDKNTEYTINDRVHLDNNQAKEWSWVLAIQD